MKKTIFLTLSLFLVACQPLRSPVAEPIPDQEVQPLAETQTTTAVDSVEIDYVDLLRHLLMGIESRYDLEDTLARIEASDDIRFTAGLIDVMRYRYGASQEISTTLSALTGAEGVEPDWHAWVEWAGNHPEIESFPGYDTWKATLFSLIDHNFARFVYTDLPVAPDSRLEEIVWGGVHVDGIPALDNPTMIEPAEADYLMPFERVFGVSINGDTRAYPVRFLDWHEMFNDVVGGEPVSLAY